MEKVRLSPRFNLQASDFLRSFLLAVLTPVLYEAQRVISLGKFQFDAKTLGMIAAGAAISYLLKNFAIEPPKTIVTSDTNTKATNVANKVKDIV